ncbi:hypothetical protein Tco_0901595 [Tanacetum coccineum]
MSVVVHHPTSGCSLTCRKFICKRVDIFRIILLIFQSKARECGKMCVMVQKPSSEVQSESTSLQLTIFIRDETGYIKSSSSNPSATTRVFTTGAYLVHDLCEDG